jgi:hypothetical protein
LFINCGIDDQNDVALLIDTGASASAMSTAMVKILGLESKLNSSINGTSTGMGVSAMIGVVENVECRMGALVEFRLFFMVLEGPMPYCILGLDQMRRFKCQVDLDEDVLVFGAKDGVKVPFLPQNEAMLAANKMMMIGNANTTAAAAAAAAAAATKEELGNENTAAATKEEVVTENTAAATKEEQNGISSTVKSAVAKEERKNGVSRRLKSLFRKGK